MSGDKRRIDVMVSSTTNDLGAFRQRLSPIITNLLLTPRMMDNDSATGKDGLTYSLDLVDEAEIYILLLGYRYGYVPDDPRNPDKLSMTHLEYRRAKERQKTDGICVLAFLLDESLKPEVVRPELTAFREEVGRDQVKFFKTADELVILVQQALASTPCRDVEYNRHVEHDFVPREGEILDERYTFERRLGQGGNGEVWKVRERLADGKSVEEVAIKLLKRDVSANPQRIERFKHEISTARRLKHPHIIRTTHWGEVGGQFYAVMDYLEGQTLRDFSAGRAFSDQETTQYLRQVAEALDYAHKMGIVHRDVKPENILVQNDALYLGDFGLAISPEEDMSLTESGELVGTKKYMAPEQWDNQPVTSQTDLYALAIIAYEMLTGTFPYDASSHARLLTQHLTQELPPHDRLPDEVLRILRRGAAKQPDARPGSAAEFIADLEHWQLDPANVETKILKYLDTLRVRLKGEVYEQLFVDLEGDIRAVLSPAREPQETAAYADRYLDDLLSDFVIDLDADRHAPQVAEPVHVPNILEQLMASTRVVLVGEPGAGKSFTLRRLAMAYIRYFARIGRVPVFVPLNAFKGETTFEAYIKAQLADLTPYYGQLLAEKRLVLLCDALNEMSRTAADGRELLPEVRQALAAAPLFVVSCRIRDYHNDLDDLQLERLEVRDMDLPAIREFIHKYLRDDGQAFWERIGGSDHLFTFWNEVRKENEGDLFWQESTGLPSYTNAEGDKAWRAMWQGAKLIPLARNPYLARVICTLHKRHEMPTNRAELYQDFVADLYSREHEQAVARGQIFPERERLEDYLTNLANQMQAGQTTVLKRDKVSDDAALLGSALDATILVQEGDDLRFAHQLLQEYFAAKTLAASMYAGDDPRPVFGDSWWQLNVWRETALMLIEFTGETERVAEWIGRASPELALQTYRRFRGDEPLEQIKPELREILVASATARMMESDPRGRAAAYRVLGLLDAEDRPGIGVKDSLPDIAWSEPIPLGVYPIGGDEGAYNSLPAEQYKLAYSYRIGKYPVTNAQFQTFLDAGDAGYNNPAW
ncbi:MAG: protein kinase, partial [Anaerolineae bacterium]|nr:protein kinase [Anaerolineae bacterium]